MRLRQKLQNIQAAYAMNRSLYVISAVSFLIMALILQSSTNTALIAGNMGKPYLAAILALEFLTSFLFGINIALLWNKLKMAGSVRKREAGGTAFGSILGVVVSGCPGCGITLASYLGLASVFSSLPFLGVELKVLGVLVLFFSTDYLARHAASCDAQSPYRAKKRQK